MATWEDENSAGGDCAKLVSATSTTDRSMGTITTIDGMDFDKMPQWKQELIQRRKINRADSSTSNSILLDDEHIAAGFDDITITTSTSTPVVCNKTSHSCSTVPQRAQSTLSSSSSDNLHCECAQSSLPNATTNTITSIARVTAAENSQTANSNNQSHSNSNSHSNIINSTNNVGNGTKPNIVLKSVAEITSLAASEQETKTSQSHSRHGSEQIVGPNLSERLRLSSNSSLVTLCSSSPPPPPPPSASVSIVQAKKCIFNKNPNQSVASGATIVNNKYTKLIERNTKQTTTGTMVAMPETNNETFSFDDTSEELQYGPGIVSKLRCRYLSLAMRQTASKQRPSLDNLRRTTSLNNLLDDDDSDRGGSSARNSWSKQTKPCTNKAQTPDEYIPHFYGNDVTMINENRYRQSGRGNDSLKRARSVETLFRYDHKAYQQDMIHDSQEYPQENILVLEEITNDNNKIGNIGIGKRMDVVTIEDKIQNARERGDPRPKRLTSFMDETERPPPDLVKHTLRLFEATANRRPRNCPRMGNGDVAAKVATFKTIILQEKPPILFPKPPLSPRKPIVTPRISSPKHIVNGNNRNGAIVSPSTNSKLNSVNSAPNLDITTIKNNLEKMSATNNLAISNGTKKDNCRSPSPQSPRNDFNAYRSVKVESPISPQLVLKSTLGNRPKVETSYLSTSPILPIPAPRTLDTSDNLNTDSSVNSNDSPVNLLNAKFVDLALDGTIDGTDHQSSDCMDSESETIDGEMHSKKISKVALVNISKAGTTTEFKFSSPSTKSHLPGVYNGKNNSNSTSTSTNISTTGNNASTGSPRKFCDTNNEPTVRQVGVILPQVKGTVLRPSVLSTTLVKRDLAINRDNHRSPSNSTDKSKRDNLLITNLLSDNNSSPLTSREIEKNLINKEKSEEAKWGTVNPLIGVNKSATPPKSWHNSADTQNNTMVFNFSNRKDVPDYIENSGLVIRRKRELPKPGESGFVVLGDLTVETSTDPDDSWTLGPPSPCDVEFLNDNIIIDGKSSIRDKSKASKFKIQFNDNLTKTFEYPSESSLLDDSDCTNENGVINNGLLGSMPLGSAPLGSYTPVKASLNTNFELGVTRTQTSMPTQEGSSAMMSANGGGSVQNIESSSSSLIGTQTTNGSGNSNNGADLSDSLQYLKPATDEQTVAWSEGTRVTDLLF